MYFHSWQKLISVACGQRYDELLVRFPGSASLRLDYAQFCEAVLNDPVKAAQQRQGAELLETGLLQSSILHITRCFMLFSAFIYCLVESKEVLVCFHSESGPESSRQRCRQRGRREQKPIKVVSEHWQRTPTGTAAICRLLV